MSSSVAYGGGRLWRSSTEDKIDMVEMVEKVEMANRVEMVENLCASHSSPHLRTAVG